MLESVLEKSRQENRDETLERDCHETIVGMKRVASMLDDGTDETGEKGDALAKSIMPVLQSIIATQALTLAGCAAKAALYLSFTREDIGTSLARDIVSLAFA